jgi:Mn-dependent DtxR family transcriptional regulator
LSRYTVTIKVRKEIAELADEMIRLGIVENKNQAYNLLIEKGVEEVKRIVDRERKIEKLVEEFMSKGLPYKRLPTVKDVYEARKE